MLRKLILPLAAVIVLFSASRNMMATAEGNLVLACSGVNRVGLVDVSN